MKIVFIFASETLNKIQKIYDYDTSRIQPQND